MLQYLRSVLLLAFILGSSGALLASNTAILTIIGTERSLATGVWDSGSVTVTVNGHSETVLYGQFSTPASIASGIAAKFSMDCSGPVNAKASGATIRFRIRSSAGTDISSMSLSSNSNDPTDFPGPTFAGILNGSVPVIANVFPPQGPLAGGTVVTIVGSGFGLGATVSFGGTAATSVTLVNPMSIMATTPAHASGNVPVVVTNGDGQTAILNNGFSYDGSSQQPNPCQ